MDKHNHSVIPAFLTGRSPAAICFLGALLALIFLVPFDEGGNDYIGQGITQVLLLCCFAIWVTQTIRRRTITLMTGWLDVFILGFFAWAAFSLFIADYYYAAFLELVKISSYLAVFYLCRILFPLHSLRSLLLYTIFGSSILQMIIGWYWYLSQRTPALQADFVNPNNFACFLTFGVNIGLSFLLFAPFSGNRSSRKLSRFLPQMTISVFVCGLVFTIFVEQSRGAVISLLGTVFLLMTLKKRRIGLFFLTLFCVLLFIPIPGGSMFERLQKRGDQFAYERFGIWKSSVKMAADHPIFGVGLGMYTYYGRAYNFPVEHTIARYGKHLNSSHNDFLHIAAELGSPGFLLFAGGLLVLGWLNIPQLRQRPPCWMTMAALTGILGLLIQSLFSNRLLSPALTIIITVLGVIVLEGSQHFFSKALSLKASWVWHFITFFACAAIFLHVIAYPFLGHAAYLKYQSFMAEQKIFEAIGQLQAALVYVPQHPNYHSSLAMFYQKAYRQLPTEESFQEAENAFKKAIHYNPHNFKYYESLARLYEKKFHTPPRQEQMGRAALNAYRRAHEVHPFSPFLLFSMATLHADLDEFDQALELLRTSVTIEPNFVGGYQMLGKMLVHLERQDEANKAFQQAEQILRQYKNVRPDSRYVASLLRPL